MYVCMYVLAAFTKLFSATKSVSMSKCIGLGSNVAVVLFYFKFKQLRQWKPLYHICIILKLDCFFFLFFF